MVNEMNQSTWFHLDIVPPMTNDEAAVCPSYDKPFQIKMIYGDFDVT